LISATANRFGSVWDANKKRRTAVKVQGFRPKNRFALYLMVSLALVISCAGPDGRSPIGNDDEFQRKPLEIYVEIGNDDEGFILPEDERLDTDGTAAGRSLPRSPVFRVWDLLTSPNTEEPGYGLYTYVLFGPGPPAGSPLHSAFVERNRTVLKAIDESSAVDSGFKGKEETNIFYLPAKNIQTNQPFSLNAYDFRLSLHIISDLAQLITTDEALVKRFTTRPGPFLISTLHPVGQINRDNASLLYIDLSDSSPDSIEEIIAAYHMKISR